MKLTTLGLNGAHDRGEANSGVYETNAFAMDTDVNVDAFSESTDLVLQLLDESDIRTGVSDGVENIVALAKANSDYIEWDLDDPANPIVNVKMTTDGKNKSFARAFPNKSISKFGRYSTIGWYNLPDLGTTRGQGNLAVSAKDLTVLTPVYGYPCMTRNMPDTEIPINCVIPDDMCANVLLDMYLELIDGAQGLNANIQPPASKMLNIQFQLGHGKANRINSHGYGWSGAQRLFKDKVEIDGYACDFGYKHETANNADFPMISVSIDDVTILKLHLYIEWIYKNWDTILEAANKKGFNLLDFNITKSLIRRSATCGPALGNEILGEAQGSIAWGDMSFNVFSSSTLGLTFRDDDDLDDDLDNAISDDISGDADSPMVTVGELTFNPQAYKPAIPLEDIRGHKRTAPLLFENTNMRKVITESIINLDTWSTLELDENPDLGIAGEVTSYGEDDGVARVSRMYRSIEVLSLRGGFTDFFWVDKTGAKWVTHIRVPFG